MAVKQPIPRQVNHACGGGLKYLGANSGVDGVSNCVLSRLGGPVVVGIWDNMGPKWVEDGLNMG